MRQSIRTLLVLCAALLAGCSTPSVLGVWTVEDYGNGPYYFGHYAYLEDGRKCTLLFEYVQGEVEVTAFINFWEIEDDIQTLTYGRSNSSIPAGHVSRSLISELNEHHFVFKIFDPIYPGIEPEFAVRLPNSDPHRVCAVVNMVLDRAQDRK